MYAAMLTKALLALFALSVLLGAAFYLGYDTGQLEAEEQAAARHINIRLRDRYVQDNYLVLKVIVGCRRQLFELGHLQYSHIELGDVVYKHGDKDAMGRLVTMDRLGTDAQGGYLRDSHGNGLGLKLSMDGKAGLYCAKVGVRGGFLLGQLLCIIDFDDALYAQEGIP